MHLPRIFSVVKRSLLLLFLFLFISLPFFSQPFAALAQYQPANSYLLPQTNPDVPMNLHTLTQSVTLEVLSSFVCLLGGFDPLSSSHKCLGYDTTTHKIGYVPSDGGLLGLSSKLISVVIVPPPVHTVQYIGYLQDNFGLSRQTYAQNKQQDTINQAGTGFAGITPLLPIWIVFRNLVYLLFVVVFIIVGFAIMLRYKIDPRTVMTIENQLPKLIVGLVLVTFSFAIAGLAIDLMWVVIFLIISILTNIHVGGTTTNIAQNVVTGSLFQNPIGFFNNVAPGGFLGTAFGAGGSLKDLLLGLFTAQHDNALGLTTPGSGCNWYDVGCKVQEGVSNGVVNALGFVISWIIGALGVLVVLIALLVAMFRLWFTLLLSYGYILLDVLLGPFFIAFGMFPGSKITIGSWLRDIFANLISFPVTIAMFLMANLLMNSFVSNAEGGAKAVFVPPLIGNPTGTTDTTNPLGWFIGIAIIMLTPQVVAMMKDLFKAPNLKYTQAAFQGIAAGGSLIGAAAKETAAGIVAKRFGTLPVGKEGGFITAIRRWIR